MSSSFCNLELSIILFVYFYLHVGVALDLEGSLTNQSSTHSSSTVSSNAVDGNLGSAAITAWMSNPWWKVNLGNTYCLKKITLTNRIEFYNNNNLRAVLRAGLSSEHLQNRMIGSPVTQSQSVQGMAVNFIVDPTVIARYVSFDIPTEGAAATTNMAIAEVMVEEITESEDTGMLADTGLDFTLVANIPLIGQTGDNEAAITAYKGCSDLTASVSFGRLLTTGGTNTGLPAGFNEVDDPILGRAAKSLILPEAGGLDRVGVFYSEWSKSGRSTMIQTILLPKDVGAVNILPEQQTLTVNVGELVTLTMVPYNSQTNENIRWKHNEDAIDGWNNQLMVSIPSVVKSDEGIYSCFMDGQEHQQRHGIMRLIVRACPSGMWGPMCLDACGRCYNGGICDDHTGICICAPGFSGDNCEIVHGRHVFGKDAQYGCSDSHDPHHTACQGHLFCLPDPYGCSCAAGYMGLDCMHECEEGKYGADCKQTCHCQDQGACLKDTGECINGGGGDCASTTYFGSNCQCSTEHPVLGIRVISDDPESLMISWEHDPCISAYSLRYALTNRGQCEAISSPVKTSVSDIPSGQTSYFLSGLVPLSTYTVYIQPIYQGTTFGPESSISGITLDIKDPTPVVLNVTPESSSQIAVEWEPVCAAIDYKVDYVLTNLGGCESYDILPSSVYTPHPDCPCSSTSVSISGLKAYSTYIVRVRVGVIVDSSYGREAKVDVTTNMAEPTAAPTDVQSVESDDTSLSFSWSEPQCGGRGGIITGYTYKLTQVGSMPDSEAEQSSTSSSMVTIHGLIPYTDYSFQVAASTSEGTGPFSNSTIIRTAEGVPPAPMSFKVRSADESSITVEWTEPDPPHGIIINYDISYWSSMEDEESATIKTDVGVMSLSYQIEGLTTDVNYFIKVRGKTSVGLGVWSIVINRTTEIGVPGPVQNLRLTEKFDNSLTLEWDPPFNINGQIRNYLVAYKAVEKRHQVDFTADNAYTRMDLGNELHATISNLEPTTKYEFKISAQNQLFTSDAALLTVFTKPLENPPLPPAPSANQNDVTKSTVTINLMPASDDAYVTSYVIHVRMTASKTKREALDPIHYDASRDDYIAAELSKQMIQDSFVVGDGGMYGGYYNAPLDTGATYAIRVGSVSRGNGTDVTVTYSDPISATVQAPSSSPVGGIVGGVLAFFVVIIIIIITAIVIYRRKRENGGSKQPFHAHDVIPPVEIQLDLTNKCLADVEQGCHKEEISSVCVESAVVELPTPSSTPSPSHKPTVPTPTSTPSSSRKPTVQPPQIKQPPFTNPPPIRIDQLEKYIQMKKSVATDKGFDADYKILPDGQLHPWTVARKPENKAKNRYANVIAYDHCRVVLEPLENDPHSDYINACYIDGYKAKDKYIASQGPNKASIKDIWRMIWQQDVEKIVMLTNPIEDGKMKCLQYWVDNGSSEYNGINVTTVKEDVFLDYTVRLFDIHEVGKEETTRLVTQFHYTTWPDMKPPEYPTPLLNFLRVVNTHENTGRTVVHCSAGVGRTGTYITLDAMLEQMKQEGQVDVLGFIYQMRHRRIKSVQTVEQYKFLFDAILEAYLTGDTTYHVTEYRRKVAALKKIGMEEQFETLGKLCAESATKLNYSGKLPENVSKNRFPDFIPSDRCRPYLMTITSEEDTNYINGTYLPGYRTKNRYIATQMPTPDTKGDIWRLVYDHKSTCIVMLNQCDRDDQTMVQYWPEAGPWEFGPLVVELLETKEYTGVTGNSFTLRKKNSKLDPPRTVCQFQLLDWPSDQDVPSSFAGLLTLIQLAEQWKKTNEGPIVVHCIDGLGRSAAFCALLTLMEKFNQEKVVNVFQEAVRFRKINNNMLHSMEHYAMCYDVVQAYMNSSSENAIYENFNG